MAKKIFILGGMVIMALGLFSGCTDKYPERHPEQPIVAGFHDLEIAYKNGWLSKTDLKSIAYYYNGGSDDETFVPRPKTPELLSEVAENTIKQVYFDDLQKRFPEASLDRIFVLNYYGTYGDSVIVKVWDDCVLYDLVIISEYFIGGVLFRNYNARTISVWMA